MDKNAFLRELALILRQRGLSDEEIRVRIEKISAFIDGLSAEERNAVIGGNPNVAAIADRLFSKDAPAQKSTDSHKGGADRPAGHVSVKQPGHTTGKPSDKPAQKKDDFKITSDYKKSGPGQDNPDNTSAGKNVAEIRRRDEEKLRALKNEAQKPRKKTGTPSTIAGRFEAERNFWVIFFCCIPILFFFAAILISIFALLFFGLIGLILLLVATLAVAVAIGSAVALIGIIYGITQFFSAGGISAVGLYEAGMGIFAAGITMLVGVLIYNAAIRFIPWIMKKLRALFKFILKKLGVLAEYLKGVCASI